MKMLNQISARDKILENSLVSCQRHSQDPCNNIRRTAFKQNFTAEKLRGFLTAMFQDKRKSSLLLEEELVKISSRLRIAFVTKTLKQTD